MTRACAPIAAIALLLGACAPSGAPAKPPVARAAWSVDGMHCGGCADAIVAEVGEVKGVRSVKCTIESRCAVVELDDPAAAAGAELAIAKLGYGVHPCDPDRPQPGAPPSSK